MTNSEMLSKFLYLCNPIVSLNYDYLVVANKNHQNQIMSSGLKIPMQFLNDLKTAIDIEDEKLSPLFPEEISQHFLDCFEQQYEFFIPKSFDYEGVDLILELLWAFSISKKELIDECDFEYLTSIEKNLKEETWILLKNLEKQIPYDDFCELAQLCENTFEGNSFDDAELNLFHNKLISKALDQLA